MRAWLALSVLAIAVSATVASAQSRYLPLATWLNDAAHTRDGNRLFAALHAAHIEAVATCSAGCTLSVPSADYAAAISVADDVVLREHLDVSIVASLPTS